MKTIILNIVFLSIFNLISSSSAQTAIITYNIPEWNVNGGFTVEATPETGQYSKLVFRSEKGDIIFEITPESIDNLILLMQKIKEKSKDLNIPVRKSIEIVMEDELKMLGDFKLLLLDEERMKSFTNKIMKSNESGDSVPWTYIMQTVRNISLEINGTIE